MFAPVPLADRMGKLELPTAPIRAVIDSDVANEIDDPFAIAHALLSPDKIRVAGIGIAPFRREGLTPGDSLRLSRGLAEEALACLPGEAPPLWMGSERFLEHPEDVVESEAAHRILEASRGDGTLHILAIGAATNVASALRMDPTLAQRAVLWWLGGHGPDFSAWEYNLQGDAHAARILLDSGIPLVVFPAWGVTSHLLVSLAALERDIEGANPLGAFLTRILREHVPNHFAYEKELWDVAVPAFAIDSAWFTSTLEPTPGVSERLEWTVRKGAPPYRRITGLNRNQVMGDLFRKVRDLSEHSPE
jgi:inosine-uridine nucleoside N-ribohydrolase